MPVLISEIALVATGGAIGSLCRYAAGQIDIFTDKIFNTLCVNVTGCIIIGILWAIFSHHDTSRVWHLFAITGLLGGYTTYSAFTLDIMTQLQQGLWMKATIYAGMTFILGLTGCALGYFISVKILEHL